MRQLTNPQISALTRVYTLLIELADSELEKDIDSQTDSKTHNTTAHIEANEGDRLPDLTSTLNSKEGRKDQ